MAVIDLIPTTDVTKPRVFAGALNGKLPDSWLRSFDGTTRQDYKLFTPVSYAMQALHIQALKDGGHRMRTTGRYRTYERQVSLFLERFVTYDTGSGVTRYWNGRTYWKRTGVALAATPGNSNHGWALADDMSEDDTGDDIGEYISTDDLEWMRINAQGFGWALDLRSEPWHWHWYWPANPNTLPQRVVDVLYAAKIAVPDLSVFGFTMPKPTAAPTPTPDLDQIDGSTLPTPAGSPSMRLGSTNATTIVPGVADDGRVSWLQAVLRIYQDGIYGPATAASVKSFQTWAGIVADGGYGPQTEQVLKAFRGK